MSSGGPELADTLVPSFFLRPCPRLVPDFIWRWGSRVFHAVDAQGRERLRYGPRWIPFRLWRFFSKGFFSIDVYKHEIFQRNAPVALREALRIAPQGFLAFGTLLGCARDGRIIPWDRDVDLGFPSELMDDALLDRFRAGGFTVESTYRFELPAYREFVEGAMGQYSKVVLRRDAKLEIYCLARGRDGRLYYGQGRPQLFVIDYDLVYPLKQVPFYDFLANVPERLEANLAYMYGDDWRTPKPRYIRSPQHASRQRQFFVSLAERPTGGSPAPGKQE